MEAGESIVQSWEGIYVKQIEAAKTMLGVRHVVNVSGGETGVLALTNQRIIWLERGSPPDENYRVNLKLHLETIKDVSIAGGSTPLITLVVENQGAYFFRIYLPEVPIVTEEEIDNSLRDGIGAFIENQHFPIFKETILNQVNQRQKALEGTKAQVVLDFSFLQKYMEKGGLRLQEIACTHRGGRMKLPGTGNTTECPYCHTTYYVEDILERVKKLIG